MANNTFTQVFVIHRFLQNDSESQQLLSLMTKDDGATISDLKCHGLKKYMKDCFNQDCHTTIINDTFDLIITKFPKVYDSIVSYKNKSYYTNNGQNYYYYRRLFIQSDLIHYLFQYLADTAQSLNNCSLVDSIWLLHAFDPKCLSFLSYFPLQSLAEADIDTRRIWTRFSEARKIAIGGARVDPEDLRKQWWGHRMQMLINGLKLIRIEKAKMLRVQLAKGFDARSLQLVKNLVDVVSLKLSKYNSKDGPIDECHFAVCRSCPIIH